MKPAIICMHVQWHYDCKFAIISLKGNCNVFLGYLFYGLNMFA